MELLYIHWNPDAHIVFDCRYCDTLVQYFLVYRHFGGQSGGLIKLYQSKGLPFD